MHSSWPKVVAPVLCVAGLLALALLFVPPTITFAGAPTTISTPVRVRASGTAGVPVSGPITVALTADLAWFVPTGWQAAIPSAAEGSGTERARDKIILDAWQGAPRFEDAEVRLRIIQTPRHQLGLAQYADAAARGLAKDGYHLRETAITTSLRADGLPAAFLVFDADTTQGFQVAIVDAGGENLLILTMAAPAHRFAAVRDDLSAMILWATRTQ